MIIVCVYLCTVVLVELSKKREVKGEEEQEECGNFFVFPFECRLAASLHL